MAKKSDKVIQLPSKRVFTSSKPSTLRGDWPVWGRAPDADIRYGLRALRARARHEAQNNDHVRSFLRQVKTHVIGPNGVRLQSVAKLSNGQPNTRLREALEESWSDWGEVGICEVTGKLSWVDEQQRCIETIARDGEAFYRLLPGWEDNAWRFAIQAIDPDTVDVDYNEELGDGRFVVMGVEIDRWRRPVAYWFTDDDPLFRGLHRQKKNRTRIAADKIIHIHLPEWVWQTRGVPWMATGLKRLQDLSGYEESAIVAARAGAAKMGFYELSEEAASLMNDDGTTNPGALADGERPEGDLYQNFDPGTIGVLPPGYKFTGWNPQFPTWEHENFVKAHLRGVAAGLGVNYNRLSSDLEGVNYSSLREGALSEQEFWMTLQRWLIGGFHKRVFKEWLATAVAASAIKVGTGRPITQTERDSLEKVRWQPRRWKWVDPSKEVAAAEKEVSMRSRSLSDVIRERGDDPDEVWEEIAADKARLEALGIAPVAASAEDTEGGLNDETDSDEDDDSD